MDRTKLIEETLGAKYDEVKTWVHDFYSTENSKNQWSPLQPTNFRSKPTVDDPLIRKVWSWLLRREDLEKEESPQQHETSANSLLQPDQVPATGTTEGSKTHNETIALDQSSKHSGGKSTVERHAHSSEAEVTLFAPKEVIWRTITGHGVDEKRVPKMQMRLLSIIAAHGKDGISQPDLVQISGQDKRSVPQRTDALCNNGYIEKKSVVLTHKHILTSICILKKYAEEKRAKLKQWQDMSSDELRYEIFHRDGQVDLRLLMDFVIGSAKEKGVVTTDALRKRLVRMFINVFM